jgi:antirestriction protein
MTNNPEAETPRIYVACLAAYNNGILHGEWIDADQGAGDLWAATRNMLAKSPLPDAEEWAIHDYQGFGGIRIEAYTSFERVEALARVFVEHGDLAAELLDYYSGDLDEALTALEEHYLGSYQSLADYVQELTEDTTAIPEAVRNYIDYGAMARDAKLNGGLFTLQTAHDAVHVFARG